MLCDESGYNVGFDVYTGTKAAGKVGKGLVVDVFSLRKDYFHKNHSLYIDNYLFS